MNAPTIAKTGKDLDRIARALKGALSLNWSFTNSKLRKTGTVSFNLPAGLTCMGAGDCRKVCYALSGHYQFKNVQAPRKENHRVSATPDFWDILAQDVARLARAGVRSIRIHDSGDFYSQKYLDDWARVAQVFPSVGFYAYTKSLRLRFGSVPSNMRIIQSYGGRYDHLIDTSKPHARIFADRQAMELDLYEDGNDVDIPALWDDTIRIGLVIHGSGARKRATWNRKGYVGLAKPRA